MTAITGKIARIAGANRGNRAGAAGGSPAQGYSGTREFFAHLE